MNHQSSIAPAQRFAAVNDPLSLDTGQENIAGVRAAGSIEEKEI